MGVSLSGRKPLRDNAVWLARFSETYRHTNSSLDGNRFESTPDSDLGGFDMSRSQQFIDDPESHHGIRPPFRI